MSDNIDERPESYGSKGQHWHPEFVRYMSFIVKHEVYQGMPDAIKDDGKIQWEAPTNRASGVYQFTNINRKGWWERKARSIGINTDQNQWISRVAKTIHPTQEKPCKRCGRTMKIGYVYPSATLLKRIPVLLGDEFEVGEFETIIDLVNNAFEQIGDDVFSVLPKLLREKKIQFPNLDNIDEWLCWIESIYVPQEPSTLSPGVHSNAPDRFDGFHSFNKCCRETADKGRHKANMSSYITDRRVFEFWTEGDWISGDRLMGLVRSKLSNERCADGGDGPPSPDHIGPISLGFCHRPEFRLLSRSANSAKNNRMTLSDVKLLIEREQEGVQVCSWYSQAIWALLCNRVVDDESALRISKILRDNQRIAGKLLSMLKDQECYAFLAYLLELHHANFDVKFNNLRAVDFLTTFDSLDKTARVAKYAGQQKSRRLRVGFEALEGYRSKGNRHYYNVDSCLLDSAMKNVASILASSNSISDLNSDIKQCLAIGSDFGLRDVASRIPESDPIYEKAKDHLRSAMGEIAKLLAEMWDDDRYIRLIELGD